MSYVVALPPSVLSEPWFLSPSTARAFLVLLLTAASDESSEGEVATSIRRLSVDADLSEKQARTALANLRKLGVIKTTRKSDGAHARAHAPTHAETLGAANPTIVTICDFDSYVFRSESLSDDAAHARAHARAHAEEKETKEKENFPPHPLYKEKENKEKEVRCRQRARERDWLNEWASPSNSGMRESLAMSLHRENPSLATDADLLALARETTDAFEREAKEHESYGDFVRHLEARMRIVNRSNERNKNGNRNAFDEYIERQDEMGRQWLESRGL